MRLLDMRLRGLEEVGGATPLGSLVKIAASEHVQRLSGVLASLLGPAAQVGIEYRSALLEEGSMREGTLSTMPPQRLIVRCRAMSIERRHERDPTKHRG